MRYAYGEYDGEEFPTPDSLFDYDQIMDFILEYGENALDAMNNMNPADAEILEQLLKEGMLDKVAGRYRLTPKAINAMQRKALMETGQRQALEAMRNSGQLNTLSGSTSLPPKEGVPSLPPAAFSPGALPPAMLARSPRLSGGR